MYQTNFDVFVLRSFQFRIIVEYYRDRAHFKLYIFYKIKTLMPSINIFIVHFVQKSKIIVYSRSVAEGHCLLFSKMHAVRIITNKKYTLRGQTLTSYHRCKWFGQGGHTHTYIGRLGQSLNSGFRGLASVASARKPAQFDKASMWHEINFFF